MIIKRQKIILLLASLALLLTACGTEIEEPSGPPTLPEDTESLELLAKFDLSLRFDVDVEDIVTKSIEETLFDDASLGVPQPGAQYEAEITPGYIIILEADGETYEYRASSEIVVYAPEAE
jgi:hypothetical protein